MQWSIMVSHLLFHIVCFRRKFLSSFALTKYTVVVIFCKDGVEHIFLLNSHVYNCFFFHLLYSSNYIRINSWIFYLGVYNLTLSFYDFQLSFLGALSAGYAVHLTVSLFSLFTESSHYFLLSFSHYKTLKLTYFLTLS